MLAVLKRYLNPQDSYNPSDVGYNISHMLFQHPTSQQVGTMKTVPGTPAHLEAMGIFSVQ